jgi:hypothetical protein
MVGTALVAGLGVFLGADVQLDNWGDLNVPRLVLGAIMSMLSAIVAFLSKPPSQ